MEKCKKLIPAVDIIVFAATTLAIAGVFYEGMTQKWYDAVGILVILMDYSFLPATLLHLFTDRKQKTVWIHVISLLMILAAVVMKIADIEYPAITLTFWYFYIWFVYGIPVAKRAFSKHAVSCCMKS